MHKQQVINTQQRLQVMKTLKNCIKLSCQVKVYVPSTIGVKEAFDSIEWIDKTLAFLSKEFGGATATSALGAWVSNQGDLVKENVTMVFAYARQKQLEQSIDMIYEFCIAMKKALTQEAIALEVNGEMYLI
jgi:hypothetical protein